MAALGGIMRRMTYWGVSSTAWEAWTAIGTLALASATVLAIWVGSRQRKADRAGFEARLLADGQERREDAARQVSVTVIQPNPVMTAATIDVTAPLGYQLRKLTVQLTEDAGGMYLADDAEPASQGEVDGRWKWRYDVHVTRANLSPMISFTDRHGDLYYQYRGITQPFAPGTGFEAALPVLVALLTSGPGGAPAQAARQPGWLNRHTGGWFGR